MGPTNSEAQVETAVVPRQQSNGALALISGGRAETAKALAAAIQACNAVEKRSHNEHHKYSYASADAIIEEGRKALAAAGLVLVPIEASLNGSEREGPDRFELVRTFALIHGGSGEITPLRVCWPVCPQTGRPLDKATAIADTLSLSYLLRDLLMMSRIDPSDDINTRDDRQQQQSSAKGKKRTPSDGAELMMVLQRAEQKLVEAKRCQPGELIASVKQQGVSLGNPEQIVQWGPQALALAGDWIRTFTALHPAPSAQETQQANGKTAQGQASSPSPAAAPARITETQAKELEALARAKGWGWAGAGNGKGSLISYWKLRPNLTMAELTPKQFAEIMEGLRDEPDPKTAAAAAV